jgi:hypothetical protein
MEDRLKALRAALRKVRGPRDQRKLLLQVDGRAKVYPDRQIEFDCVRLGMNFDL